VTAHLRQVRAAVYTHHSFSAEQLANVTYIDCDFSHANFTSATLKNVTFDHCNLNHALFPIYTDTLTFIDSSLANADFTASIFKFVHFEDANADALLRGARVTAGAEGDLPALYCHVPGTSKIFIDEPKDTGILGIDVRRPAFVDYDFDAVAVTAGHASLVPRAISLAKEHPRLSAASLAALLHATIPVLV
jgi:hypothetical protein